MTPKEVLAKCRQKDIKSVSLRFTDLFGGVQSHNVPVGRLSEDSFESGFGVDGSSVRGWKSIHESDMLAIPQVETAYVDPFANLPTMAILCNIQDPMTGEEYSRDPRTIARKAATYLESTGIADTALIGAGAQFFIFEECSWAGSSSEASRLKGNDSAQHLKAAPGEQLLDLCNEMMQKLTECGVEVDSQRHKLGSACQAEITLKCGDLVSMADAMTNHKHIVKNVARQHGRTATFMPKPIYGVNGSAMHTNLSLWKDEQPLFAGNKYAGLSDMALYAIGGMLKHASALLAFTNPITNSYKRLASGCEAPVALVYSHRNRSAACRIPSYDSDPKTKRVEFRCPDSSCNPYLAFAAILMAALDGIQNKINPGDPVDENLYEMEDNEFPSTPRLLSKALDALESDQAFLLRGDVFTHDVLESWLKYKHSEEVDILRQRPHPHEFKMYYDI